MQYLLILLLLLPLLVGAQNDFRGPFMKQVSAPPDLRRCSYLVTGAEFVGLPVGVAAKKAALVAIAKREAHTCFDRWVAERAAAAQAPLVRDPLTDLGATSFSDFTGQAAPTP